MREELQKKKYMEARTSTINANQLNLVRISINEHKKRKEKRKMLVQLCDGPHDKQVKTKEQWRTTENLHGFSHKNVSKALRKHLGLDFLHENNFFHPKQLKYIARGVGDLLYPLSPIYRGKEGGGSRPARPGERSNPAPKNCKQNIDYNWSLKTTRSFYLQIE